MEVKTKIKVLSRKKKTKKTLKAKTKRKKTKAKPIFSDNRKSIDTRSPAAV
jgi:hypothetical protein